MKWNDGGWVCVAAHVSIKGSRNIRGPIKEMEMKNWTRMKVSGASEAKTKVCVVRNQAPSQITGSQLNVLPPVNFARIIY